MPIVETDLLKPGEARNDNQQVYNALDCCITLEVFEQLDELLNKPFGGAQRNSDPVTYDFARAMQAPALEMMMRGFKIDEYERQKGIAHLQSERKLYDNALQEMAFAAWGGPLNPGSPKQLKAFFYEHMLLPEQYARTKGVKRVSTNREALEKLELYLHARPFVASILEIRDIDKQLDVLLSEVDSDGRIRTSYNIAGTETGRWSSSYNSMGTGTNLQNLQPRVRPMFVSDQGFKLVGIDLQQTESFDVGWLCGILFEDWTYFNACLSGDLHTGTVKLIWPNLGWTGDKKKDKQIAEQEFYREYTYRYMAKRGGHATNYLTTPWTMSRALKIPIKVAQDFQSTYLVSAYPAIPRWHRWTAQEIQTKQLLVTPFGRQRHFFGRVNDDATLREAVAFVPQGTTADRLNLGLWRVWKYMGHKVQILAQVHDAAYFQFPEKENEEAIVNEALQLMLVEMRHRDKSCIVPGEAKTGWNWGEYCCGKRGPECVNCKLPANPNGMKKLSGPDTRTRQEGLNRIL